ncbi:unnamed protein product [Chrysodeixis includens]|uniref:Uncharacterized protein n=1 Tax=Chrysodeixis includens TaxID=689277 RepID=A0A9N8PXN1_CHRIL|nr:unnamed protein product [Chrysodeixis includens]
MELRLRVCSQFGGNLRHNDVTLLSPTRLNRQNEVVEVSKLSCGRHNNTSDATDAGAASDARDASGRRAPAGGASRALTQDVCRHQRLFLLKQMLQNPRFVCEGSVWWRLAEKQGFSLRRPPLNVADWTPVTAALRQS